MVLSAGEVKSVGWPQIKAGTQLRGLQKHRLGHGQGREKLEELGIGAFQDRIASLDRPHQAFAFDQR